MNIYENYDNIYRFMDIISSRPTTGNAGDSARKNPDDSWHGMSYEKALDAFANGLPDKANAMAHEVKRLAVKTNSSINKARPRNYYHGYTPNIPAAIIGLPKSMRQIQKTPQKVKALTLFYDATMNAGTGADELEKAGFAVLKLVWYLEKSGCRVRLDYSPFAGSSDNQKAVCALTLKDWRQPLDLLKLSFPLSSAAMFRRFGFRWIETVPGLNKWGSCKGSHLEKEAVKAYMRECGYNIDNVHVITVTDCKRAGYDPENMVAELGIKL